MRHIFALVTLLAIVQATFAQIFADGDYRIFYGKATVPRTHRFFTAKPDAREGSVQIYPREESKSQVWRLRNKKNGQITLESKAARGKYLGLRRSGANPGAYLGVVPTPVKFVITEIPAGQFTRYELAYPKKVNGKTLVVSMDSKDKEEPYYVNLQVQGTEGIMDGWKFARV
ncbi:MAG: hypothetical protein J3Q66DRAFT_340005 [Benniella sp.]|nr:MAG: hypothetical protein J3Q66DRAFT_340005 [Benniella sp.]